MIERRKVICATVRAALITVESIDALPPAMRDHAGTCLRCQAHAARIGSNRRTLSSLVGLTYAAPPSLLGDVMRSLDTPEPRRGPVAGAVAAGVATAGVAAVVVWRKYRTLPAIR